MSSPLPSVDPAGTTPRPPAPAWRAPLAASALVAAAAHVPVTGEHLREALYIGVLFVLLEIACVVLAVVVLRGPSRPAAAATALLGCLAIAAFVITRSAPMPLIGDDVGRWTEPLAVVSVVAEALMAVVGLLALRRPGRGGERPRAVGPASGAAVLAAGALAIGIAVLPTGASAQEGHDHGDGAGAHGHAHDPSGADPSGTRMPGMDMPGMDMTGMDMSGTHDHAG